jgi:hypothetical protein
VQKNEIQLVQQKEIQISLTFFHETITKIANKIQQLPTEIIQKKHLGVFRSGKNVKKWPALIVSCILLIGNTMVSRVI